ncbi:MAG TPA: hypothetical protein QF353_00445 [Gammaproteobacteria bacterium]|nr:hypothetical protein [Gammaproteobacteria bacterium]
MSYPSSLSFATRILFGSFYFVTACVLYFGANKDLDLIATLKNLFKHSLDVKASLKAAWKFITQRTFYLVMISINLYGTSLMSTALTSDLMLAAQQLSGILGATSLLIVNNTLQLLRGLYTFANAQFYLAKADFVANDYESDIKPYLATPYAMMIISLTVANALVNGFINTLNRVISPMTLFDITVSAIWSCSAMLSNFFEHKVVSEEITNTKFNKKRVGIAYYQLPSFYQLIPTSQEKSISISIISTLWYGVLFTPSLIGYTGTGMISLLCLETLRKSYKPSIYLRRKVSEMKVTQLSAGRTLEEIVPKKTLDTNEKKAQILLNNKKVRASATSLGSSHG